LLPFDDAITPEVADLPTLADPPEDPEPLALVDPVDLIRLDAADPFEPELPLLEVPSKILEIMSDLVCREATFTDIAVAIA
jgi:hypothetical protein